ESRRAVQVSAARAHRARGRRARLLDRPERGDSPRRQHRTHVDYRRQQRGQPQRPRALDRGRRAGAHHQILGCRAARLAPLRRSRRDSRIMKTPGPGAGAPLVTIAIPTYNRAASYLPLPSALDQTYPDIEVMVSDNASSDGTAALVSGVRDPRLRYLRHAVNIGA